MGFERTIENFVCQHCGAFVIGDGYTNHCPHCLWSRHVDEEPGDRAEPCNGMMRPAVLEGSSPDYRILHVCEVCGFERVNKVQAEDATPALLELAEHPHKPLGEIIDTVSGKGRDTLEREHSYPEADKGEHKRSVKLKN